MSGVCPVATHVIREAGGVARPRVGAFRGRGPPWCPLCPVEGVVQRFPGRMWGVGDTGGESQAVSAAWWERYLVVGGVRCRPPDLAVVIPFYRPPGAGA